MRRPEFRVFGPRISTSTSRHEPIAFAQKLTTGDRHPATDACGAWWPSLRANTTAWARTAPNLPRKDSSGGVGVEVDFKPATVKAGKFARRQPSYNQC